MSIETKETMTAIISQCRNYRYRLERNVNGASNGKVYAFFGINPSTADATVNDATVKKWIGFTEKWGGSRFIVGNVFGYRSTDVSKLAEVDDPRGPDLDFHNASIIEEADILVPCWGRSTKVPLAIRHSISDLMELLLTSGKPVRHFGLTKSGDPYHPLTLSYETPLQRWTGRR